MKKTKTSGLIFWLLLVFGLTVGFISCKKDSSSSEPTIGEPAKTAKGEPIGTATEKMIGPEGGILSSADGSLTVKVPAGAVTTNTPFSIQPITNTLTGNNDTKPAFRLSPEGTTFNKPVEVSFNYKAGTPEDANPQLITAAYQTAEGNWKAVPGKLNKDARNYTFETTHFSDWTVNAALWLSFESDYVTYGDTVKIYLFGMSIGKDDFLCALTSRVDQVQWRVLPSTKGKLIVDPKWPTIVEFTPANLPPNTSNIAEISVKLTGQDIKVFDETLPGGYATFKEVTLLGSVEILGDSYMKGTFRDQKINITTVSAVGNQGSMTITGQDGAMVIGLSVFAIGPGTYNCGEFFQFGKAQVTATFYTGTIPKQYATSYEDCGPPRTIKFSNGQVVITEWGDANKPVKGYFTGAVYTLDDDSPNSCPTYEVHQLSVEFRTRRSL